MTRESDLSDLSRRILRCANDARARGEFLRGVSGILLEASGCDAIELRTSDGHLAFRCRARRVPAEFHLEIAADEAPRRSSPPGRAESERMLLDFAPEEGAVGISFTEQGSCWSAGRCAAVLFSIETGSWGCLMMLGPRGGWFTRESVEFQEAVARILGLAIAIRRTAYSLRERVKELTCLHGIARLAGNLEAGLEEILRGVVALLPPAWQHPEMASARIVLDGRSYASAGFREGPYRQATDIVVEGEPRGAIEVFYVEETPDLRVRPFLEEERALLEAVAREVALIVLHKEAEAQRARLEAQLRHADRLATIGQLSAGVAHELNEPLNGVLGFAQLAMRAPGLPEQAGRDIEKIVKATLHAREVVRKLMLFSRQIPPRTQSVDLNQIVGEGLYFLESRCAGASIEVRREMAPDLPAIEADPSQLHQVLVNLVVNAIQAMPTGGRLVVRTARAGADAALTVEDTGTGMDEEVRRRLFTPFFTTKGVGQGTGLGLAVVHGIVRAHGGSIHVESEPGRGSRFEVTLPGSGIGARKEPDEG